MSKQKPLTLAFKELRKSGYLAKQNFCCCQSCAWAGNGKEIVEILNKYGIETEWSGSENTRIKITIPK